MILGASSCRNRCGEHLVLKRWFPEPSGCEPHAHVIRLLAPEAHKSALDPDQWLFLDTETTGLSGGTGTYPFLIGVAWWDAGGLQVEQFFMRDFSEEYSLLHRNLGLVRRFQLDNLAHPGHDSTGRVARSPSRAPGRHRPKTGIGMRCGRSCCLRFCSPRGRGVVRAPARCRRWPPQVPAPSRLQSF